AAEGARSRPTHQRRSLVPGPTVSMVPIGPECHHDHPTGDPHPLASRRLPSVLALEIPPPWRSTANRRGSARADSADERGKSAVGSAAHPWRVAQARLRGRSVQRREVHGQAMWTAVREDAPLGRAVERSGTFVTTPICSACIINTRGHDFREGQGYPTPSFLSCRLCRLP